MSLRFGPFYCASHSLGHSKMKWICHYLNSHRQINLESFWFWHSLTFTVSPSNCDRCPSKSHYTIFWWKHLFYSIDFAKFWSMRIAQFIVVLPVTWKFVFSLENNLVISKNGKWTVVSRGWILPQRMKILNWANNKAITELDVCTLSLSENQRFG